MMDKSELLFQMMEQPEQYSDEQWREILADDECKALYSMLTKVQSAIEDEQIGEAMSDEQIDREWDRFCTRHNTGSSTSLWQRIAAVVAIAMVCVGLGVAAVYTHIFSKQDTNFLKKTPVENISESTEVPEVSALPDQETETEIPQPILYDNVPLELIIKDLSDFYNVRVEWRTDEARDLRLYYQWEPSFTLDKVVDMLNSFEAINITREGETIIIEQPEK